jgi:hypothetical protein
MRRKHEQPLKSAAILTLMGDGVAEKLTKHG